MMVARAPSLAVVTAILAATAVACAPQARAPLAERQLALELSVPGDFTTIQAAVDAAAPGDTVVVAPGNYFENVQLRPGVTVLGGGATGPDQTTLTGQFLTDDAQDCRVSGFLVSKLQSSGLVFNAGFYGAPSGCTIDHNTVQSFHVGVFLMGPGDAVVEANVITNSPGTGVVLDEVGDVLIVGNIIQHNKGAGLAVQGPGDARVVHNTFLANGFSGQYGTAGAAVVTHAADNAEVVNNLIVSNKGGINAFDAPNPRHHHNLVWGNSIDYVFDAAAGAGDVHLDPQLANAGAKDYRLLPTSPAIDAGIDAGVDLDHDGGPRLAGAAPDLGAFEYQPPAASGDLLITEVMANPLSEATGEFVELHNPTDAPVDAAGLVLDDGDASDAVIAWQGGATVVPAGGYAVILDNGLDLESGPYDIPAEAVLLTVGDATLGSGLAVSDPVTLRRAGTVVDAYQHPFNPGNGLSAERIDLQAPDGANAWSPSPCGASPGAPNCIASGGAGAPIPTLVITEVMATPDVAGSGEFLELYNFGDDPISLIGLVLDDGDATDTLEPVPGKASELAPGQHAIVIDPDLAPTMTGAPYQLDAEVPVVVTVGGGALGNGIAKSDPLTILTSNGGTIIATFSHPYAGSGQSVERKDPLGPDVASNWTPSPCPAGHSAGRPNCAYGSTTPVALPALEITEVMANPLDEDRGEFVELHNTGTTPVDAAGLFLGDDDAVDQLLGWQNGPTVVPAGGYAVVLDPEYDGAYAIPASAVLLVPDDTTIGNSLTTNDPLALLAADGLTVVSTFSHPFNPGNGVSAERAGDAGDVAGNWVASPCATGSSPGSANCALGDTGGTAGPQLVISEVMANPLEEATGEFVELANTGDAAIDVAGFQLSDGDAVDTLEGLDGGPTTIPAGGWAVIVDRDLPADGGPYDLDPAAILLTVDDGAIGSGLATSDPIELLSPDGSTVVAAFAHPFNPGNGVSVERLDLAGPDEPSNWAASSCDSGSSPGSATCDSGGGGTPGVTVVDINTADADALGKVLGIGPSTANQIIAYREENGAYESVMQLTVSSGITPGEVDEWATWQAGEPPYVVGVADARPVQVFSSVAQLKDSLPLPGDASAAAWEGTRVRLQRAVSMETFDNGSDQTELFADWGNEDSYEPEGDEQIPVFLEAAAGAPSYDRSQTNHANALSDWEKEDGDPYLDPVFYRWATPLPGWGPMTYGNVFSLEGVLEVHEGDWRIRIRPAGAPGIDRVVMIERWIDADLWAELKIVWAYNYKPAIVVTTSGYTYALPRRLVLAHPVREYWLQTHGETLPVPQCTAAWECEADNGSWQYYTQALNEWHGATEPAGGYCFTFSNTEHCFSAEEQELAVEILNEATFSQLTAHCYTPTMANLVLANRPYTDVAQYDAVSGVGSTSLWYLLDCYVRSGDWPEAASGTVHAVLQSVPASEGDIVEVFGAEVVFKSGQLFEICDQGTDHCIKVYSFPSLPSSLSVGDLVDVKAKVTWFDNGGYWDLVISASGTWVHVL